MPRRADSEIDRVNRNVAELKRREAAIRRNIFTSWLPVAEELTAIHGKRLYRDAANYATFEEYLDQEFGQSRQWGYDHIHGARVVRRVQSVRTWPGMPLGHVVLLHGLETQLQVELVGQYEADRTPLLKWRQLVAERKSSRNGHANGKEHAMAELRLPAEVDLRVGDAAEPPPEWTDQVDLQITSPPYCLGIREADYVDFDDYDAYLAMLPTWSAAMYRVAAPWARIALVVPIDISRPRKAPVAADWIAAMQAAGWRYETAIVWEENNISRSVARGSIDSATSPKVICPAELIPIFCKGIWDLAPVRQALRPDWGESDLSRSEWLEWTFGLWRFPGEKSANVGGHPAAFPEELPSRLIRLLSFPGAVVGDLFLGSGTTAAAATQLGRHFVGGDISERWVNYARDRVARRTTAA
jgi:site-specific DNA-methyltransferase (adenine-specific)